jgi:hypothetical protein
VRGSGTVVLDKRINTWSFQWWQDGKRKTKSLGHHKTKTSAWKAAKSLRDALETKTPDVKAVPTVNTLIEQYRAEKMPQRYSSRRSYEAWLKNHIAPKWGACVLSALQPRPVEKQVLFTWTAQYIVGLCHVAR